MNADLSDVYRGYIDCLNRQDWPNLGAFVDDGVRHNDRPIGLSGYREMLERDFDEIPDLHFDIRLLVANASHVACRLSFDCSPKERFLGVETEGKRVSFMDNLFYDFRDGKIVEVWSVIDKAAVEAQP